MDLGNIAIIVGMLFGGGILVEAYHWVKDSGKREESVDADIGTLDDATARLNENFKTLEEKLDDIEGVSVETRERQASLTAQIKALNDSIEGIRSDTKENTRAVLELNAQVKELIRQLGTKQDKSDEELEDEGLDKS